MFERLLARALRTFGHLHRRGVVLGHWQVAEPERLAARLPAGVELDRFGGSAWVSVVAFRSIGPAPAMVLESGLERLATCTQVDVRTYGRTARGPGLVLLQSFVDRPAALGPRLLGLPYRLDPTLAVKLGGDGLLEASRRGEALVGELDVEPAATPGAGSLDEFLLERYWVYGDAPGLGPFGLRIAHRPWKVREAWLRSTLRGPADRGHFAAAVDDVTMIEVVRLAPSPALVRP